MSTTKKQMNVFSRREFLKASGLSAGGLIIGVSLPVSVLASGEVTDFEPGAFIHSY